MKKPPLIALEIHDASLWEPSRVLPVIETMEHWGYNALVLHQNDLLDVCTQLFLSANYGVTDLRLKKVRNNVAWLNRLVKRLDQFGAKLFLEVKEPSLHDYVLESYPDLLGKDGVPDPTHPSWFEFCQRKTQDLLDRVPGLGGLIITISSPESRVSMPDFMATKGRGFSLATWFDDMITAFHEPLKAENKDLYIRDFSYTPELQSEVLAAVDRKNGEVGASIKITAHDYFPEFPENPVAENIKSDFLFEFEAFGEHTGWGVIPNCRVEEFARRMHGYREKQASGMLVRISWEAITGAHALDGLSSVNVFALPRLTDDHIAPETLVLKWLNERYEITGEIAHQAANLLLQSWYIPAAAYWNTQVFPRHSCLPSTWQEGWLSMETNGMGSRNQEVEIKEDDPRLSEAARVQLFARKEKATALAEKLAEEAEMLIPDLPTSLAEQFLSFEYVPFFAKQFELATKLTFYSASNKEGDRNEVPSLKQNMLKLADELEDLFFNKTDIPHHHRLLLSPEQIRGFVKNL